MPIKGSATGCDVACGLSVGIATTIDLDQHIFLLRRRWKHSCLKSHLSAAVKLVTVT